MTEYVSNDRQLVRDKQGNISQLVETLESRSGKLTRITRTTIRDEKTGDMIGINEVVEDAGWSPVAIERLRQRHEAEKFTRRRRESSATEVERTPDGAFRTRARSGR